MDVRIGLHPGFTRVVLETDEPARHRISRDGANRILVHLDAQAASRRLPAPGPLLGSVEIEPTSEGSLARLELRGQGIEVRERALGSPPRVVLDLHARAASAVPPSNDARAAPVAEPAAPIAPAAAPVARSVSIRDVRVGLHDHSTRVVIETDGRSNFHIEPVGPSELVVLGDARATPREIAAPGEILRSVAVESTESGSSTRLRLRKSGVEVRYQVLESPPRLVLDLHEKAQTSGEPAKVSGTGAAAPTPEDGSSGAPQAASGDAKTSHAPVEPEAESPQPFDDSAEDAPSGPRRSGTKIYKWVDENGIAHYTADPDRIPEGLRDQLGSEEGNGDR